jgi:hypothetical protein
VVLQCGWAMLKVKPFVRYVETLEIASCEEVLSSGRSQRRNKCHATQLDGTKQVNLPLS